MSSINIAISFNAWMKLFCGHRLPEVWRTWFLPRHAKPGLDFSHLQLLFVYVFSDLKSNILRSNNVPLLSQKVLNSFCIMLIVFIHLHHGAPSVL